MTQISSTCVIPSIPELLNVFWKSSSMHTHYRLTVWQWAWYMYLDKSRTQIIAIRWYMCWKSNNNCQLICASFYFLHTCSLYHKMCLLITKSLKFANLKSLNIYLNFSTYLHHRITHTTLGKFYDMILSAEMQTILGNSPVSHGRLLFSVHFVIWIFIAR